MYAKGATPDSNIHVLDAVKKKLWENQERDRKKNKNNFPSAKLETK